MNHQKSRPFDESRIDNETALAGAGRWNWATAFGKASSKLCDGRRSRFRALLLVLAGWLVGSSGITDVRACGPFFPNMLLLGGDLALLEAPQSDFAIELRRLPLSKQRFTALPATNGLPVQTAEAEWSDLQRALAKLNPRDPETGELLASFQQVRRALRRHAEALEQWRERQLFRKGEKNAEPRPDLAPVSIPAGLPGEFRDYLAGSVAFHAGDTNGARAAWQQLLERPDSDRFWRSTWAAFMLGKTLIDFNAELAVGFFQLVRHLAEAGFSDSLGLAAASYGWEAKAEWRRGNHAAALRLYLIQHQTGDPTALVSLRLTVSQLLSGPPANLEPVAWDPVAQRIVTAYLVSRPGTADREAVEQMTGLLQNWLAAVKNLDDREIASADSLALAAYRAGLFDLASGWLQRAGTTSAMAQWLRAKLLLREGNVAEAAKLLASVSHLFAKEGEWSAPIALDASGSPSDRAWNMRSLIRQSMGEMGVLHLARREYYEALDTLLRAGFWNDAAYVAEVVLAPDEVMAYADRQWPEPEVEEGTAPAKPWNAYAEGTVKPGAVGPALRYLVARRLARLGRWTEAIAFYPVQWRPQFQAFAEALQDGRNPSLPVEERAKRLWTAAQLARHGGMELLGTELEPDWHVYEGQFQGNPVTALRGRRIEETLTSNNSDPACPSDTLVASSEDEQRRVEEHKVQPARRFHYRYMAAELGWEAAQLMPDNTDETARVLWQSGSWVKARDPKLADRFYKALVNRCRRTRLGHFADIVRWFPPFAIPETLPTMEAIALNDSPSVLTEPWP